jgi:hypothetical protein
MNGSFMRKEVEVTHDDDLRSEYDFLQLKGAVRGKYAAQYREGTNLICLDDDVARAFPNEEAVNEALRLLMKISANQAKSSRR